MHVCGKDEGGGGRRGTGCTGDAGGVTNCDGGVTGCDGGDTGRGCGSGCGSGGGGSDFCFGASVLDS